MKLRYRDIKKRHSNFIYDLLTTTHLDNVKKIIENDDDILTFELKINGVEVPIVALERMYKEADEQIEIRAKHKAIKMLDMLKYQFGETIDEILDTVSEKMSEDIINFSDEIQIAGFQNDIEAGIGEDQTGDRETEPEAE